MQVPVSPGLFFLLASLMLAMMVALPPPFFRVQTPTVYLLGQSVYVSYGKSSHLFSAHQPAAGNRIRRSLSTRPASPTFAFHQGFWSGLAMCGCENLAEYISFACSAISGVLRPASPLDPAIDLSLHAGGRLVVIVQDLVTIVLRSLPTHQGSSLTSGAASAGRVRLVAGRSMCASILDCHPAYRTDAQRTCVSRAVHASHIFCGEIGRLAFCTRLDFAPHQRTGSDGAAGGQEPADFADMPSQKHAGPKALWNNSRAPFEAEGAGDSLPPTTGDEKVAVFSPFFSITFAYGACRLEKGANLPHCFDSGRNAQDGPLLTMLCIAAASIMRINGFMDTPSFTTPVLSAR